MDVEAVLNFLRENNFKETESALNDDVSQTKQDLIIGSSFDFHNFQFPMNPPLSPVKLPTTSRSDNPLGNGPGLGSDSGPNSSEDEDFKSLNSSTTVTAVCSSDFTNMYVNSCAKQADSETETSSDRLSQFGTAREYHEFDMQTDLWYNDKDEGPYMSPSFGGPIEDKFVMTRETVHLSEYRIMNEFDQDNSKSICEASKDCLLLLHNGKDSGFGVGNDKEEVVKSIEETAIAVGDQEGSVSEEIPYLETNEEEEYEVFDLRIVHRKNRTGFEEMKEFPIVLNTIVAGRYYITEYLGSAAFSKVVQAQDIYTGIDVCLKIIKNDKDFFDQSLDEIKLLKYVNKHDPADEHHIIRLYDYFYHQEHLFIVCELLRANLYEFQKYNLESGGEPYFTMGRLQAIARQCLEALDYLHGLGVIHCDLKPENILIKNYGRCEIKVIDLGSSCFKTDNLCLYIQSRSYRAPEVILGLSYGPKIDIWSLGCVMAELCSGEVLFPNDGVVMLLARMIGLLGPIDLEMLLRGEETPKYFTKEYDLYHINEDTNQVEYITPEPSSLEQHLPVYDDGFIDFVNYLLQINSRKRPSAREALSHPWLSYQY